MKTMCPPDFHCNGFAATHALAHITYILSSSCFYDHL